MASGTFQLVMRSGPNPGKVYELKGEEISIGRDVTNNIIINDAEISRRHTSLKSQAGGYLVEDLGSTNGTFVNGQRLMGPHMLRSGELISLGENIRLEYEATSLAADVTQIDHDATIASSPSVPYTPPVQSTPYTPPVQSFSAPPPQRIPPPPPPISQPSYSGQVPPGPVESYVPPSELYPPEEGKPKSRTLLYAGFGCLVILLCIAVGAAFVFDYLNLYCTPPFELFFPCS